MKLRTCGPPRFAFAITALNKAAEGSAKDATLDKHDANAGQAASTENKAWSARLRKKL